MSQFLETAYLFFCFVFSEMGVGWGVGEMKVIIQILYSALKYITITYSYFVFLIFEISYIEFCREKKDKIQ